MEQNGTNALKGNTSSFKARRWVLVLNNYTDDEFKMLEQHFNKINSTYIIGKEIGESGTPHLQMYLEVKNPISFNALKKLNERLHIEKAKGTIEQNMEYCKKDGNYFTNNISIEEKLLMLEYGNTVWKPWQQNVINLLNQKPDTRTINWIWEENGNVGKSYLCKYISMKYDSIICTGKTNDIFNQLLQWRQKNPDELQTPPCIIDVPRSEFCHINYAAIEQLKNGFVFSGKYEGGKYHGLAPHIFIFANSPPTESKLSCDRWNVIQVE